MTFIQGQCLLVMVLPSEAFNQNKYGNLGDRMIKQLLNLVITKYHDLSVSRRSILDLRATDKSPYFVQPRPIIVKL